MIANRLGFWSSASILAIGVAYAVVLAVGVARHGLREPIQDPVLAAMEVLTLLSAPPVVVLIAALLDQAAPERKVFAVSAMAFATLFAGTTCAVHFVELTAGRQLGSRGLVWPSAPYAAELLAWDVFLGLALVFVAASLRRGGREGRARQGLLVCGSLCLAGAVGPVVNDMRLQVVGILGYAVVLPVVAFLLNRMFARVHWTERGRPTTMS